MKIKTFYYPICFTNDTEINKFMENPNISVYDVQMQATEAQVYFMVKYEDLAQCSDYPDEAEACCCCHDDQVRQEEYSDESVQVISRDSRIEPPMEGQVTIDEIIQNQD